MLVKLMKNLFIRKESKYKKYKAKKSISKQKM